MNLKKWRYGGASLGLTAGIIALCLAVNLIVGLLCSNRLWHTDMTAEGLYTLSDETSDLLELTFNKANEGRAEDDPVLVDIIFCADPDMLRGNERMRYIYYTALEMQKAFPESICVSTRDVWDNPSSVDAYRTNSYSSIYQTNVIVASGSEFRIYSQKYFYTYDTNDTAQANPWAYDGEKAFLSGIIAVTRAESPVCAITVNHGEPFATETGRGEYSVFLEVLKNAGYDVVFLDLEKEEIPKDCRLVITFDPQTDFVSNFMNAQGTVSETAKLETFLADDNSFMVFADADTPKLSNLEELLEEWGIAFERHKVTAAEGASLLGTYEVIDPSNSLDLEGGRLIGQYASAGLGASLTQSLREMGGEPKVLFGNALSIAYSPTYEVSYQLADAENGTDAFTYAYYNRNNQERSIHDVFRTGADAYAYAKAGGSRLTDAEGNAVVAATYDAQDPFRLMTLSRQSRTVSEDKGYTTINKISYVCAVGSTEFASNAVLGSNAYGNTDLLLATLREIGREIEPVGISFKMLASTEADAELHAAFANTAWTVVLTVIPAVTLAVCGTVVLIRRRVRS